MRAAKKNKSKARGNSDGVSLLGVVGEGLSEYLTCEQTEGGQSSHRGGVGKARAQPAE